MEAHRRIAALFDRCLTSLATVEVVHQSTGVTRHLCKEVREVNFGVLNFFEHPAGDKSEHRVFKEQLDTRNIRVYRDRGSRLSVTQNRLDLLLLAERKKDISTLGSVGRYGGWFQRQTLDFLLGARLGFGVGLIESGTGTYYESDCAPDQAAVE